MMGPPQEVQRARPRPPSRFRRDVARPGGCLPLAIGAPWVSGVPGPPTGAVWPRVRTLAGSPQDGRGVIRAVPSGATPGGGGRGALRHLQSDRDGTIWSFLRPLHRQNQKV